jgi:hypothetical protein
MAVHQHRAAATLTLRAAAVFHGAKAEPVAENLEQGRSIVRDLDIAAVDLKSQFHLLRVG